MKKHNKTLVLDASYIPRAIIDSARAFAIFYKGNAEIVENHDSLFGVVNPDLQIYKPSIIRIKKNIRTNFLKAGRPSRENVFKRDSWTCVYCGCTDKKTLTIDHVIPKSRGGKDTWENLVTACFDCNQEKNDLTIKEWGKPQPVAKKPHFLMLLKTVTYIPEEWKVYLLY